MRPPLPRTFRMRLLLLSTLLSGAIVLGFGFAAWQLLHRHFGPQRLDAELRGLARGQLALPRRPGDWPAFEEVLDYWAGLDASRVFAFAALNRDGRVRYRSHAWPEGMAPADLVDVAALPLPPPPPGWGEGPEPRGPQDGRPRFEDRPRPEDRPPPDRRPEIGGAPGGDPRGNGEERRNFRRMRDPNIRPIEVAMLTRPVGGGAWRIAVMATPGEVLLLAADLTPYRAEAVALRNAFLAVLGLTLLAIGAGGWYLAVRAVRPVQRLAAAAESITAQALDRRIPASGSAAEFERLVQVFNQMLERLERSFRQANRFSADAAHELKTPLTILQGQLNQVLQEAPPGSPLQQRLGELLEEVQRLSVIIRKLLLLSQADAGAIPLNRTPVALDAFLASIREDIEVLAPDLAVEVDLAPGVTVLADESLLQQAVQNLTSNAIKYNTPGGRIRLALRREAGRVRVSVANTSPGIAEADRKRLFNRFFRADPAHSRAVDGVGLGLSLAREIARAHGGDLWLAEAPPGWVQFILEIPDAPPAGRAPT